MLQKTLLAIGGYYIVKTIFYRRFGTKCYYFDNSGYLKKQEKCKRDAFFIQIGSFIEEIDFNSDFGYLVRLVYCESREDNLKCMKAVAQVVINRLHASCFRTHNFKTIKDVIFDTHNGLQFGCINHPSFKNFREEYRKNSIELKAFINAITAAYQIYYLKARPFPFNLLYFRSDNIIPDNGLKEYNLQCHNYFWIKPDC